MIFLLLNFYIIASHYTFLSRLRINVLRDKILAISITFSAQIVLTQIILGSFGKLNFLYLGILNILISSLLISAYFINCQRLSGIGIKDDLLSVYQFLSIFKQPYNVLITFLSVVSFVWLILASYLLPPRGVDDLVYHLPAIYEYLINEEIFILPTSFMVHFAFPMNAELILMWPLNFIKSTTTIGLTQLFYCIVGMSSVYCLARSINISRELSYFCSQIFFLTPLVLLQTGSGYRVRIYRINHERVYPSKSLSGDKVL